ncbi:MAG: hypothetical protein RM347_019240 [Nostoc sp. ChiQUE02]|uniref:hypothetical protein n=1 Tax=Nostoc sp. ChiQUE02 TaxID=3075377 RepID=UPI002AD58A64|nr:hypothetical protein [Nostoc sp. ChiQUE02]MDZ8234353.1 hypothetical protein [Nostoc sp. ChiQUE02]
MSKHYYHFLGAGDFHCPHQRNRGWESAGLFTSTSIDWQIKRSPVCLFAHHKITALLTPLPHGRGVMPNEAIPV